MQSSSLQSSSKKMKNEKERRLKSTTPSCPKDYCRPRLFLPCNSRYPITFFPSPASRSLDLLFQPPSPFFLQPSSPIHIFLLIPNHPAPLLLLLSTTASLPSHLCHLPPLLFDRSHSRTLLCLAIVLNLLPSLPIAPSSTAIPLSPHRYHVVASLSLATTAASPTSPLFLLYFLQLFHPICCPPLLAVLSSSTEVPSSDPLPPLPLLPSHLLLRPTQAATTVAVALLAAAAFLLL
ncbi:hypothetical protein GW17_00047958 [Ensete ventricosum]|nr:hypothetical protein GW17_00047958 [Ensete ventricosum]RZR78997.1 hypothetical protein BHM03_00004561 [Ensete ventricosum]